MKKLAYVLLAVISLVAAVPSVASATVSPFPPSESNG